RVLQPLEISLPTAATSVKGHGPDDEPQHDQPEHHDHNQTLVLQQPAIKFGHERWEVENYDTCQDPDPECRRSHIVGAEQLLAFQFVPKLGAEWRDITQALVTCPLSDSERIRGWDRLIERQEDSFFQLAQIRGIVATSSLDEFRAQPHLADLDKAELIK